MSMYCSNPMILTLINIFKFIFISEVVGSTRHFFFAGIEASILSFTPIKAAFMQLQCLFPENPLTIVYHSKRSPCMIFCKTSTSTRYNSSSSLSSHPMFLCHFCLPATRGIIFDANNVMGSTFCLVSIGSV